MNKKKIGIGIAVFFGAALLLGGVFRAADAQGVYYRMGIQAPNGDTMLFVCTPSLPEQVTTADGKREAK